MARERLSADRRRRQILDVTAAVVDVEGFHAATLDRIARDAGVTRTVLYQHFGGLDGLLDALVDRATRRIADTLADIARDRPAAGPLDAMAHVLAAVDEDPATWRLFLLHPPAGPASLARALDRGRASIRRQLSRDGDGGRGADVSARLLQAVADEVVRLRLADPSTYTHRLLLDRYGAAAGALLPPRAPAPASGRRRSPRPPEPT